MLIAPYVANYWFMYHYLPLHVAKITDYKLSNMVMTTRKASVYLVTTSFTTHTRCRCTCN